MRERVKTVVLLLLVASSMLLTARLLFGQPHLETAAPPAYEHLVFGELRPQEKLVLPELRLGEETVWQFYKPWHSGHGQAWDKVLDLLRLVDHAEPVGQPAELAGRCLVVQFPVPSVPELWLPGARLDGLSLTQMRWYEAEQETVWLYADGAWYQARLRSLPQEWPDVLTALFAAAPVYRRVTDDAFQAMPLGEIFIPQALPALVPHTVKAEQMETDMLLRSIFINTALVRRIEERDGAVIYTDGQRGLRVFDHGELEFTSPKSEPGSEPLDFVQALRRTAQYLQLMGGWPDELLVKEYKTAEKLQWNRRQWDTYTVTFRLAQLGVPLISAEPPVELRFSDRGVITYNRQIRLLEQPTGEPMPLINPLEALKAVAELLGPAAAETQVAGIEAVYFLESTGLVQSLAQPAWLFQLSNHPHAVVHGHTGQFLGWLE